MSRPKPSGRSYGRLTRHERNTVERMLDLNRSAREIAAELGRSPSTVTREVAAHRYVTAPRSRYGEPAPADLSGACPRLSSWPRCCNGCSHRRGYGCSRRPRVFYVSVNLFFTSFAKQARRSRKGGFTGCANVFSPIPVTA
ncbi:helix-turn-helix domain-containing protein [Collinsella sp. AF23-4AC]|uniref:helix-turn-helix domain-containing protein n=1 Tax=Collinsella sp. AF23-4AC TaxID=2292224 RepID=UPI00210160F7|nr:helix-turn-helix domain-containing protein [Collinsella sp. AF23-4AC]